MKTNRKPKLAVWKFASCDGCQLSLLDCEDELLSLAGEIEIANFLEASRAVVKGPYDLSLVEGSITTPHDAARIQQVRQQSKTLITIGACATAGGIQALRNFQDVNEFVSIVYARPDYIRTLAQSTPIAIHVKVDFELHGCPINKQQLLEVISAFLNHRKPNTPAHSVCVECKLRGNVCVMVAVSWPRDARGLRRALSVVSARLLRLLRPDGNAEHRCAGSANGADWNDATGSNARVSWLQCVGGTLSRGE
jgi:coenzyme F420-reducing hydrogenase gamma subunit